MLHQKILRIKPILVYLHFLLFALPVSAQQKVVRYAVLNKGDTIGNATFTQKTTDGDMYINVVSQIKVRMVVNISVNVHEQSHYNRGKLVFSSVKRFVNDKPRTNKETKLQGNYYLLLDDGKENRLAESSLNFNMSLLYFTEPAGLKNIYSDNYQKLVPVQVKQPHVYEIDLPDGGKNTYYYNNGVCTRVTIENTFVNTELVLLH